MATWLLRRMTPSRRRTNRRPSRGGWIWTGRSTMSTTEVRRTGRCSCSCTDSAVQCSTGLRPRRRLPRRVASWRSTSSASVAHRRSGGHRASPTTSPSWPVSSTRPSGTRSSSSETPWAGLLALLLADLRPDLVSGLVLVDPAVPVGPMARPDPLVTLMFGAYAVPAVARVFMSRRRSLVSAEAQAMAVLRLCCVDTRRVPKDVVQQHLLLARERQDLPDVDAELVVAGRSLVLVLARRRWLYAVMGRISAPVLLLHGSRDRLVPIAAARTVARRNPTWRFEVAKDVGHVPQLEVPRWTMAASASGSAPRVRSRSSVRRPELTP